VKFDRTEFKRAVLQAIPEAAPLPLDDPPALTEDATETCPACSSTQTVPQLAEDAAYTVCQSCGCEFIPRVEPIARSVIRSVCEHRNRRLARVFERFPLQPPPGVDPVDYAAFTKAVDDVGAETDQAGAGVGAGGRNYPPNGLRSRKVATI